MKKMRWLAILFLSLWLGAVGSTRVAAVEPLPIEFQNMGIDEKLGQGAPLDVVVTNEAGKQVPISQYFHQGRPVILNLVYYNCPMLCTLVLNGLTDGLKELEWLPGQKFEVITLSIDARETWQLAAAKKEAYLEDYGRPEGAAGWHWTVGSQSAIDRLTKAVGFRYFYDPEKKEFAHPAAIMVLTPEGKISRYLYGISFNPRDLRLGLVEASEGRIGSPIDQFLLFCYHYDPASRRYALYAMNIMRLGGGITVAGLGAFLALYWRRERRLSRAAAANPPDSPAPPAQPEMRHT